MGRQVQSLPAARPPAPAPRPVIDSRVVSSEAAAARASEVDQMLELKGSMLALAAVAKLQEQPRRGQARRAAAAAAGAGAGAGGQPGGAGAGGQPAGARRAEAAAAGAGAGEGGSGDNHEVHDQVMDKVELDEEDDHEVHGHGTTMRSRSK